MSTYSGRKREGPEIKVGEAMSLSQVGKKRKENLGVGRGKKEKFGKIGGGKNFPISRRGGCSGTGIVAKGAKWRLHQSEHEEAGARVEGRRKKNREWGGL